MNKLVLFDMDGLLIDSEPLHLKAYKHVFEKAGYELTTEEYITEWVQNGSTIFDYFIRRNLVTPEYKELVPKIREEKWTLYESLILDELNLKEGAKELLDDLDGKIKVSIASSSRQGVIEKALDKFKLKKYFQEIVSMEKVKKLKPNPEGFLLAAKNAEVKPKDCVVLEDAEKGLVAAKKAKMKCIICLDEFSKNGDFRKADLVVNSLKELNYEIIKNI